MRLLIIPTWFPHRCFPLEGEYVLDQALAIADLRPSWRVGLSLWNQGEGHVSRKHVIRSPACLFRALTRHPSATEMGSGVVSFNRPQLSWSHRVLSGNRERILDANRANLAEARKRFGDVDLVHAHVSYPAGWVAMRLCEESGIPYVVTEHMGPFPLPVYRTPTGLPSFIREPLERAQARIAVSPTLAEQVESFGIVKPSFVPNLVDERLYRPEAARPQREFVFFTLCGMETAKGVDDLLEAIALMLPRLPEEQRHQVRFRLGGEGPALERFRRHARRLGLDAWVTWLGLLSREHSRVEYQSCDAFVLTSHRESFGIVFVEATACGKPVIATRCGGPEAIVTPENGLLVEVGDIGQIADALESMVRGERAFDAGAIRIQFLERFSRSAVVSQLEEIYRGALSADTGRADTGRGT